MALLTHQKISYVLPGKPFGRGTLGAYSSATAPTMIKDSCSGTATSTTLTTSGSTFANGDLIKIIQMRGTGVGQWEIALVSSGGGSTSLTLSKALTYTYTDSGASQAQAIKINEYTDVTVQSGTWSTPAWDGNVGGVLTFACKGTITPTGTISANGGNGTSVTSGGTGGAGGTGAGHAGGAGRILPSSTNYATQGTSQLGTGTTANAANGGGGGGGRTTGSGGEGGGGGYGSAGTTGQQVGSEGGIGGGTYGDTNLQTINLGSGGGGGANDDTAPAGGGGGGSGAGIISIFGKTLNSPTSIICSGGNGGAGSENAGGGGGSGGSILICAQIVNIGTDKLSTIGGSGGAGGAGGDGGKGRIAVYYGTSLTGSVSSTLYGSLNTEQDTSLKEVSGGMWLMF